MEKRILQLFGSFHLGGSEKQAVMLTKGLVADGRFEIFAATLNSDGPLRDELSDFQDIPEYPLTSFYNSNFVTQVRKFADHLGQKRIDLIQTHDFYTNVFGMAAGKLAGVTASVASKRETLGMRSRLQEFVEGLAFKRANAVISNSDAVRDLLLRSSVPAAKIHTIYNGVDPKLFEIASRGVRKSLGLPCDKKVITLVANLRHDVKNVPMFLRAARKVTDQVPETHFAIAGEGELETGLRRMATDLGIDGDVSFLGSCDDVPGLLESSYAGVLTSNSEGFSNSILEYMAAGKPVVATRVGGAAEAVVEGETGFLVEPDDDEQMAKHLIDLVNSPSKAEEFGREGRSRVKDLFSPEVQVRKTIELYSELLATT